MTEVRLDWVGKIISGDSAGWFIKVIDDGQHPKGSYLILTSDTRIFDVQKAPEGSQGFDDWVENWNDLELYFKELNRTIEWLWHEPPQPPNP